jgi:hypothetical protein
MHDDFEIGREMARSEAGSHKGPAGRVWAKPKSFGEPLGPLDGAPDKGKRTSTYADA